MGDFFSGNELKSCTDYINVLSIGFKNWGRRTASLEGTGIGIVILNFSWFHRVTNRTKLTASALVRTKGTISCCTVLALQLLKL